MHRVDGSCRASPISFCSRTLTNGFLFTLAMGFALHPLNTVGDEVTSLILKDQKLATSSPATSSSELTNAPQREISVPLFIEHKDHGEINIIPGENDELKLEGKTLLQEIRPSVTEQTFNRLRDTVDANGKLSLRAIKAAGLNATFDERKLEFQIGVPPEIRQPTQYDVFHRAFQPEGEIVRPSRFSAFVNVRLGVDYIEESPAGTQQGLQTPQLDLVGAMNFNNWVAEGQGFYDANAAQPWHRGDVRLVHDDPDHMLRYAAGDLSYPVTSFQTFIPLGGLTVARNFSLQPYRVTEPLGNTAFFLKNPSKVEVLVNGRLVQTLQLPAGQHNLRNFPFASGANDVTLRITDPVGRVETITLSFFFDSKLLSQGEHEFAYSVGLPSRTDNNRYRYEADSPTVSAFHRIGLTDKVTAGINLQADHKVQMAGAEGVFATPIGAFQGDYSVSHNQSAGFGQAARLQYRYYDASIKNTWGRILTLGVTYKGRDFSNLGVEHPNNSMAW